MPTNTNNCSDAAVPDEVDAILAEILATDDHMERRAVVRRLLLGNSVTQQNIYLSIIMVFNCTDIAPHLSAIRKSSSYIPAQWALAESDLELVKYLFDSIPYVSRGTVAFQMKVKAGDSDLVHKTRLLADMARRFDGKKLVTETDDTLLCLFAAGGEKNFAKAACFQFIEKCRGVKCASDYVDGSIAGNAQHGKNVADMRFFDIDGS